jgi:Flp pilus assembly protein TadB
MAQTKRKRRTKHRGNAAGMVEARGRTGRPPSAEERKRAGSARGGAAGNRRMLKEPTWKSALMKSGVMAVLLFVLTQLGVLGAQATVASGLVISVIALLLYTPLAFWTDKWAYSRQQRRLGQQAGR